MVKHLEISDETYERIKEQLGNGEDADLNSYKDLVGKKWYFRTVTYHMVGEVVKLVGSFVMLKNSSWVADSGRWMQAIRDGVLNEVEPTGVSYVNINTVTDFVEWKHPLPKDQK